MDAEKAARRIVEAVRRGDAEYVVGFPAKLAAVIHGLLPGMTADAAGAVARLFLAGLRVGTGKSRGKDSRAEGRRVAVEGADGSRAGFRFAIPGARDFVEIRST